MKLTFPYIKSDNQRLRRFTTRRYLYVLFSFSLSAIVGASLMFATHASTYAIISEAEDGTLAGKAFTVQDTNASGGKSVRFGPTVPGELLSLANWKLTLPIGTSGSPQEVTQPALNTYTIDPWFHLNSAKSGVVFHVNHGGVTTSGSSNPRSELREMSSDGSSGASWSSSSGVHTMYIKQAVTHLTTVRPHVVVGQIHDASNDITVFRLEGSSLWITDDNNNHGYLITDKYQLGTVFTVKFEVSGGKVSYYYNDQLLPYTQSKSFSGAYFKAGNYLQSNPNSAPGESTSAYSEVEIYDLKVTHQ